MNLNAGDYMNDSIEYNKLLRGENLNHLSIFKVKGENVNYDLKNPNSHFRKELVDYVNHNKKIKDLRKSDVRKSVKRNIESIQRRHSIKKTAMSKKSSKKIRYVLKGKSYYITVNETDTYLNILNNILHLDKNNQIFILNSSNMAISQITDFNNRIKSNNIWIRDLNDPIDPIGPISTFDLQITSSRNNLSSIYRGWRIIRGDGNCYYRAVIF